MLCVVPFGRAPFSPPSYSWLSRRSHRWRIRRLAPLCAFLLLSAGSCGRGRPAALPPLELAASPEPRAEADFRAARDAREAGRTKDAGRRLRAFLKAWPTDPLVPFAKLELGRLELGLNHPREAQKWFDQVAIAPDPALAERGRMYAAIAAQRLGQHREALTVLRPLVGRTLDPVETALLLDSVASAEEAIGDDLAALETRDRELASSPPSEQQKRAVARVEVLVEGLDPAIELPRAYELLPRDGHAWPLVARRLLRVSFDQGERERVSQIGAAITDRGLALDEEMSALVLRAERSDVADPMVIGAILPLSGRGREVGEAALHGLLLAAEQPNAPRVVYRDDAGDPARAVTALDDLVSLHRAIAIVGPLTAQSARAVLERAKELEVPVLVMHPDARLTEGSNVGFRLLGEPHEEADVLVQAAVSRGARRFVVLHGENPYGATMQAAFAAMITRRGGTLVGSVAYPPTATSFVDEAERVEALAPEAVVLCDGPTKVALLAPALAARGLWSVAPGAQPPEGKRVLYVLPAAAFSKNLASTARRYLQGALFAVPFDPNDAPSFAASYREKFQADPNLYSALGYDAFRLVNAALASGASSREDLVRALTAAQVNDPVATGSGFAESHGPRAPTRLKILLGDSFVRAD
jgi:branched-chain amino acid transport system substrate-binding protein